LRSLTESARNLGVERIRQLSEGIAASFGGTAEFIFQAGYPVTVNDPWAVDQFRTIVGAEIGTGVQSEEVMPVMGAEDFSFYGHHVPACFYWLGLLPKGQTSYPNLHAPEFDFNDDALETGIRAMCSLALAP
jgi:metal-dependent amidase/aminoacylase/carboxypeptidase family protein